MRVKVDLSRCTACVACELACGYHRDDAFAFLSACIVPYRAKEKKDYIGVIVKEEENLMIARPEGLEIKRIGAVEDEGQEQAESGGDASAKPMLLREPCDLCSDIESGPMCVKVCPFDAIHVEE